MAPAPSLSRRLSVVADRLARRYGRPRRRRTDPLSDLVQTVLSQHTSDVNSDRAFRSLRGAFPSWESVARARPEAVEAAIRMGGLARTKSRTIVRVLGAVREREGCYDLTALRRLGPAAAAERLRGLPGWGRRPVPACFSSPAVIRPFRSTPTSIGSRAAWESSPIERAPRKPTPSWSRRFPPDAPSTFT